MALPLCDSDSTITLTTALQSSKYVEMTLRTLREFGAEINVECVNGSYCYKIKKSQKLTFPNKISIDGDWSNAAFWLTAGAISDKSEISVTGLNQYSVQGDRQIAVILSHSGTAITYSGTNCTVSCGTMPNFDVSMEEIPDLLPILAVRAACGSGETHFTNAARLRLKESDRLTATAALLCGIGGTVKECPDGLCVAGGQLCGGTVDAQNDHRLVMAAAIAATRCAAPVTIVGAEAVSKSYPAFFEDYRHLGGKVVFLD